MTMEEKADFIWKHNTHLKMGFYALSVMMVIFYIVTMWYINKTNLSLILTISISLLMLSFCGIMSIYGKVIEMTVSTILLLIEEVEELKRR